MRTDRSGKTCIKTPEKFQARVERLQAHMSLKILKRRTYVRHQQILVTIIDLNSIAPPTQYRILETIMEKPCL